MGGDVRARIGRLLRRLADRIDYHGAPRYTGWSFTFEAGEGIRFREDKHGCPVAYLDRDDYLRAHRESDSAVREKAQMDALEAAHPGLIDRVMRGIPPQ